MSQKQTKRLALLQRRQQVAELALQGWSQAAIAEQLKVVQATISGDLTAIRKEWLASALRDFDQARAIELQKLDLIKKEAWAAWQRSQKPQQSAVFTGTAPGPESKKSMANRYGDARFLEQVNKCIAQRRALLGLDIAPGQYAHGGSARWQCHSRSPHRTDRHTPYYDQPACRNSASWNGSYWRVAREFSPWESARGNGSWQSTWTSSTGR